MLTAASLTCLRQQQAATKPVGRWKRRQPVWVGDIEAWDRVEEVVIKAKVKKIKAGVGEAAPGWCLRTYRLSWIPNVCAAPSGWIFISTILKKRAY